MKWKKYGRIYVSMLEIEKSTKSKVNLQFLTIDFNEHNVLQGKRMQHISNMIDQFPETERHSLQTS
jgi:hypothetical protein